MTRRADHDRRARPIPPTRQQSDNAKRRDERRSADRRASNERWRSILAGAADVFRREGFGRARLEDVAAQVGINRASLYYYVGTKEELLIALIEEPAREMTRHCREALESDGPADLKLRRALRHFVDDLQNHPELFLLFGESHHITAIPEADGIIANAEDYRQTLLAIIEDGIATGDFRQDLDARLVMYGVLGMHNWIHHWYVPGGRNSLAEIGDVFAEMVLSGLRPCASHP
ncbi:AcrR family transcriptional regulator [Mycolicibacterium sp. BK634]|uniref:TetR/AcrR family transcriptional regulator n=1 Tax=Mycolicibacterium sp. BK634 TaxID=2587099 RepID=UPI00178DA0B2|nr:TetR/AcrR family transcriptional regulator [Mycolicibacterium sp. BK634]MBB3752251.1 AcrR family transcriptional regulator [Mycolicibacterium sp. BK634]